MNKLTTFRTSHSGIPSSVLNRFTFIVGQTKATRRKSLSAWMFVIGFTFNWTQPHMDQFELGKMMLFRRTRRSYFEFDSRSAFVGLPKMEYYTWKWMEPKPATSENEWDCMEIRKCFFSCRMLLHEATFGARRSSLCLAIGSTSSKVHNTHTVCANLAPCPSQTIP